MYATATLLGHAPLAPTAAAVQSALNCIESAEEANRPVAARAAHGDIHQAETARKRSERASAAAMVPGPVAYCDSPDPASAGPEPAAFLSQGVSP